MKKLIYLLLATTLIVGCQNGKTQEPKRLYMWLDCEANFQRLSTPDSIDYYHLKNNAPEITMTVNTGTEEKVYDSLYVRDYLDVKDKYSSFTGSNQPIIEIDTNIENGKKLLIVKDSYAHSLVPFLANHYEKITMVDMRYINGDLNYFIDMDEYNQALFMFNAVSFSTDEMLDKIQFTK